MNRKQLEHVLRAGGSLTSSRDLVVIGSQAILGSFPNAPADLAVSKIIAGREKDIGFVRGMLRSGFITESAVQSVAGELKPCDTNTVLKRLPLCR